MWLPGKFARSKINCGIYVECKILYNRARRLCTDFPFPAGLVRSMKAMYLQNVAEHDNKKASACCYFCVIVNDDKDKDANILVVFIFINVFSSF